MENLNAEQTKKALECCTLEGCHDCRECPQVNELLSLCKKNAMADALALINSQEQKIKELTEENERLRAEVSVKKKLLDKCVDLEDKVKADTVQKYREKLYRELAYFGVKDKFNKEFFLTKADQVAKEMLEKIK